LAFAAAALLVVLAFGTDSGLSRRLTTVLTVNSTADSVDANPGNGTCADSGGACSLRAAIQEADVTAGQVQIAVPAGTYALTIANPAPPFGVIPSIAFDPATGDLDVAGQVSIVGAGVGQSVVAAQYLDRVIQIASGANVVLQGLTLEHGQPFDCAGGLGIYNGGTLDLQRVHVFSNVGSCGSGGGVYNVGVLTANGATIEGNRASGGGGLHNAGTATFAASTFSDNHGDLIGGGGIANFGTLTVTNVTFSGNAANASNGGAFRLAAGSAALRNVTIVSNGAGGSGHGGALRFDGGTVTMQNTLLAYNAGGNCAGGTPTSLGHNIADLADCSLAGTGDISSTNPLAAALADNGGPVQTAALQVGSPALDAGAGCAATDARGIARPQGPACDIGAYEAQPTYALTLTLGGSGTVISSPAGISCPSMCSASYVAGTSVTLTATPASGNSFSGWSGACSGTGACTVSLTAATAVVATFAAAAPTTTTTTTTATESPAPSPAPERHDPSPRITFTPNPPVAGQPVQFSASAGDSRSAKYSWNFGDGTKADGQQASHIFGAAGTYLVTVTAADASGAEGTAQASLGGAGRGPGVCWSGGVVGAVWAGGGGAGGGGAGGVAGLVCSGVAFVAAGGGDGGGWSVSGVAVAAGLRAF
jgi:CSLREA domain-containing protein